MTGSYEAAAKLAAKVGCAVEDSTLVALVQRLGARAEAQTQARLQAAPVEKAPQRAAQRLGGVAAGWLPSAVSGAGLGQAEERRNPAWNGTKRSWGCFIGRNRRWGAERGQLVEKVVVGWQGEPLELGRRLHWEALRGGLGRARERAGGGRWGALDLERGERRWAGAHQLLDFYHASQHLWALGEVLEPKDEGARRAWVEERLHRLRHGQEQAVLREIAALPPRRGEAGKCCGANKATLPPRRSG